jgi:hypothetical protein
VGTEQLDADTFTLQEWQRMNGRTETPPRIAGNGSAAIAGAAEPSSPGDGDVSGVVRSCAWCGGLIDPGEHFLVKYCSQEHRRAAKSAREEAKREAEKVAASAGPGVLETSRPTAISAAGVAPSVVAGNGDAVAGVSATGDSASAERPPSRTTDAGEAEHGPDAGQVLEAHAVREVRALALELLEHGAEVELESPGGWRVTAHPRT